MIAAMSAHSKDGMIRGTGAAVGAITSGIGQAINASLQAHHQNEMAEFQRKMATVGRARLTPEEIAKLVQKKSDQVADNMFCITFGSDKFLLKPAPYFRKVHELPASEADTASPAKSKHSPAGMACSFIGIACFWIGIHSNNPMFFLVVGFGLLFWGCWFEWKHRREPASPVTMETVQTHLRGGDELNAIKAYRTVTGDDYKTAKEAVERMKSEP